MEEDWEDEWQPGDKLPPIRLMPTARQKKFQDWLTSPINVRWDLWRSGLGLDEDQAPITRNQPSILVDDDDAPRPKTTKKQFNSVKSNSATAEKLKLAIITLADLCNSDENTKNWLFRMFQREKTKLMDKYKITKSSKKWKLGYVEELRSLLRRFTEEYKKITNRMTKNRKKLDEIGLGNPATGYWKEEDLTPERCQFLIKRKYAVNHFRPGAIPQHILDAEVGWLAKKRRELIQAAKK